MDVEKIFERFFSLLLCYGTNKYNRKDSFTKNTTGNIFIPELEMSDHILQYIMLECFVPLIHKTVGIFSENTPTMAWV